MIELILSLFKEGDYIKIFFNSSLKFVEGRILKILANSIAVQTGDGKIVGIKGDEIDSFEQGSEIVNSKGDDSKINNIADNAKNNQEVAIKDTKKDTSNIGKDTLEKEEEKKHYKPSDENKIDITHFKPGDIIPLEQLEKIDPKIKKGKIKKDQKKLSTIGNDFSALSSLVEENHEIDDLKVVPALGEIKLLDTSRNFGFIKDGKTGKDIYFSLSQILGEAKDPKFSWLHAPVVYSLQNDVQGPRGVTIHRPKSVKNMLQMSSKFANDGEYKHAFHLVEQVLSEYPDNFSAYALKKNLAKRFPMYSQKPKEYSNAYSKAKKFHSEKNYSKAIEYYLKAIKNGEKVESSIKDLGMLYAFLYKSESDASKAEGYRQKAVDLMDEYSVELSNSVTTWNYLENFYYSVKEYESFIKIVDNLLETKEIIRDKIKQSALLYKKSVALVKLNEIQEAIDTIEEALGVDPTNQSAIRLQAAIEDNPDDIEAVISATEFDTLNSGISQFIQQTIDSYDEYAGVPAKIIEANSFDKITLREIHKLIDTAGKARARERAKYLLTEGKLISMLEPENTGRLRAVMARYCNAMALNHISDYSSSDITRFYYNEAFSLEESYHANATQVSLYLLTHFCNNTELLNMTTKSPSVDDVLHRIAMSSFDIKCWESILSMFLYNREISAQIISKLYINETLRALALQALQKFGISGLTQQISKENFVEAWNNARDARIRDYKKTTAQIKALCESSNIEDLCSQLLTLRNITEDWMTSLDNSRINTILNNIQPALETYLKSTGYRNKEANKNNAVGQIRQLLDEIKDGPTKLSYEAILPLLKRINELVVTSFNEVIKMSTPRISIKLLSSETVVNENNEVSIQISISNHKDSSPIKEVTALVST